jgi:SAM-dependent methyltransferase
MGLPLGSVALDVGCGEGSHAIELHRRFGFQVFGIDPVRRHLDAARAAAGEDGPVFTPGTAEDIPARPRHSRPGLVPRRAGAQPRPAARLCGVPPCSGQAGGH